jgi:RNA polymerase sigma-70 factor (ECF subfamily)
VGFPRKKQEEDGSAPLDDDTVIHRILAGEVNAYELLLNRYKQNVLNIVRRHVPPGEIEEIAQTVFVRAYQSLASFRPNTDFRKWISSIAVRSCHDYWRKVYRNREIPISSMTDKHDNWLEEVMAPASSQAYDETNFQAETKELLEWALNQLSPQDRMVIELVYLEGMKGKEAAELLGWSTANVKVRTFRSRRKLRKLLLGTVGKREEKP